MKHLPYSVHRAELGHGSCKTLKSLVSVTGSLYCGVWTCIRLYGIWGFPHTYRAILREFRSRSWTGHSGFWSFPVFITSRSLCSPQALCSLAVTLCVVLVFLMWRVGIAQQPPVSTVWLPDAGGSPDIKTLLKGLFRCVRLCTFI